MLWCKLFCNYKAHIGRLLVILGMSEICVFSATNYDDSKTNTLCPNVMVITN